MAAATPVPPDPEGPAPPPRRRSWPARAGRVVVVLLAVAMLSGAFAYAAAARADARQSWSSSQRWATRSLDQDTVITAQQRTIAGLDVRTKQLETAVAEAGALLDARTAEAETLRSQIDEVTTRLAATEAQLAELAGVRARATDEVLAGG